MLKLAQIMYVNYLITIKNQFQRETVTLPELKKI